MCACSTSCTRMQALSRYAMHSLCLTQVQLFMARFSSRLVRVVLSAIARGVVAFVEVLWPSLCMHHLSAHREGSRQYESSPCAMKMLDVADLGSPWNCCASCDSTLPALRHWGTQLLESARRDGYYLPRLPLLEPPRNDGSLSYKKELLHPMKLESARQHNITSCGQMGRAWAEPPV